MNSKLLFAATVAVSLISMLVLADAAPLTRVQVHADSARAGMRNTMQIAGGHDTVGVGLQ